MTDKNSESDTGRRSVLNWGDPAIDISGLSRYNPLLWPVLIIDLFLAFRWYVWHKRQSWGANRKEIHYNVIYALQKCNALEIHAESEDEKKAIREVEENLRDITDELNLQSKHIDRYSEEVANDSEE